MFMHPAITTAIADQHRRDLIAQADAYRLARTARDGRTRRSAPAHRPASAVNATRRAVATLAAACAAAAVLLLVPAGAVRAASAAAPQPSASVTADHVFAPHVFADHVF